MENGTFPIEDFRTKLEAVLTFHTEQAVKADFHKEQVKKYQRALNLLDGLQEKPVVEEVVVTEKPANGIGISDAIKKVCRNRPLTIPEILERVQRMSNLTSKSKNMRALVSVSVQRLMELKQLKKKETTTGNRYAA